MIAPIVLSVNFLNYTYATNPCSKNVPVPAVMKNGSFSYFDKNMGSGFDLHVDAVYTGSLAPGTRQAVVVMACDFPVGGTAAAYVFSDAGTSATMLAEVGEANWGPDWGAGPQSIHVRFLGKFLYVDACKEEVCEHYLVTTYELRNGRLVKVYQLTHKRKP